MLLNPIRLSTTTGFTFNFNPNLTLTSAIRDTMTPTKHLTITQTKLPESFLLWNTTLFFYTILWYPVPQRLVVLTSCSIWPLPFTPKHYFFREQCIFVPPTIPVLLQILGRNLTATNLLPNGSVYTLPANKVTESQFLLVRQLGR